MKRERFGSRLGFILISAGCAIGLGNVWRFPYITGQYGGAAFVLIYLFFLLIQVFRLEGLIFFLLKKLYNARHIIVKIFILRCRYGNSCNRSGMKHFLSSCDWNIDEGWYLNLKFISDFIIVL